MSHLATATNFANGVVNANDHLSSLQVLNAKTLKLSTDDVKNGFKVAVTFSNKKVASFGTTTYDKDLDRLVVDAAGVELPQVTMFELTAQG